MNTASVVLSMLVTFASVVGTAAEATPMPTAEVRPDRQAIQVILIEAGYSGVASLRLVRNRWVGVGANHGLVVLFTVDAMTGRILNEVEAR